MTQDNTLKAYALQAFSMRELVDRINANNIHKEDIACLTKDNDNFFLIYYK